MDDFPVLQALDLVLRLQYQPVSDRQLGYGLHVVGCDEVTTPHRCRGSPSLEQCLGTSRRGSYEDTGVLASPSHNFDHVQSDCGVDVDVLDGLLHRYDPSRVGDNLDLDRILLPSDTSVEDLDLVSAVGVADAHLHHETV